MQFWNELEGQTIDGLYPLRRLVRSEGRRAWFETETGALSTPATISLTEAATDADEVLARLQSAQQLKHSNLVDITRVGHVRIDDTVVVYALMEHIEQNLSDVLQSQALSAQEGREVAEALVGALTAIHQTGMSHGHMEAASVLATEETVKLRSDCLQNTTAGQADDVAGIGAILFQAFTQRKAATPADPQINRIPAPFAEIVRNSFTRRWTLGQIANALKPAAPVAVAAPLPQEPLPPAPERIPVAEKRARPAPSIPVAQSVPLAAERAPASGVKKPSRTWLAAVAVALLAIVGWLFLRPHAAPAPVPSPSHETLAPAPAPEPTAKPPASKPSAAVTGARHPKTAPAAAAAPVAGAPAGGRSIWRVVVYTYKGEKKAADGVAKISDKHPDLDATVFNPAGSDVYMVTLGGGMDRSQAQAMLEKAKREGLPGDTYIRNFSQ